jgi:hypothetical protein
MKIDPKSSEPISVEIPLRLESELRSLAKSQGQSFEKLLEQIVEDGIKGCLDDKGGNKAQ